MRPYSQLRQAYLPRRWPDYIIGVAIVVPATLVLNLNVIASISVTVAVSVGVVVGHFLLWKWRHPIVPPEKVIDARRRNAPWN